MSSPGQRAVVVGGASGIGAAVAARHRAAGAEVVVWDVASGADIVCDLSRPEQVDGAVQATLEVIGVPSMVSVTAGVGHGALLLDASAEDWDRVVGINAKGVWLAMRALARAMLDAAAGTGGDARIGEAHRPAGTAGGEADDGGSIVAVSSVSARLADRSMGLYGASKAALEAVIRTAAVEWAPTLRVNGVAPGVTDTPMLGPAPRDGRWLSGVADRTALGRLGRPDDIARTVMAVHDLAWVTGQIVQCDGGLALHSPIDPLGRG